MGQRGLGEGAIALRAELVLLGEHQVEHHGAGLLRHQAGEQLRVHHARPGKAPGRVLHLGEAALVDVDDDDVRVGREARRVPFDERVEQAVLERLRRVQEQRLERGDGERGGGERGEQALHRGSASTSASAWNRSTEASSSSRLIDTLSTLTPSGISLA